MATQRQNAARSKPSNASSPYSSASPSNPPSKPTRKNSFPAPGSSTTPLNDDDLNQKDRMREDERSNLFQTACNKALRVPEGYLKVAVLIIRWHPDLDDYAAKHTQEIARLDKIFRDKYRFSCKVHSIPNDKSPQVNLNMAIMQHITEHDAPNSLLIFYYTGHGSNYDNGLELSATRNYHHTHGNHLPTALWEEAEKPIRLHMQGDALSILDCCMASMAAVKWRSGLPRNYEILAASPANASTRAPGDFSFTTALCSSLDKLFDESNGEAFPLNKLYEEINKRRPSEACVMWDQLHGDGRHIRLGKLENTVALEDSISNAAPEQSSLRLRLSFEERDLSDDQIKQFAERLPQICNEVNLPIRRIDWMSMTTTTTEREIGQMPPLGHNTAFEVRDESIINPYNRDRPPMSAARRWQYTSRAILAANRFGMRRLKSYSESEELQELKVREALPEPLVRNMVAEIFGLLSAFALLFFNDERSMLALWRTFIFWILLCSLYRMDVFTELWRREQR